MKWFGKFIEVGNGKLFTIIIAVILLVLLALFTSLQEIDFILKIIILIGVVRISLMIKNWLKKLNDSKQNEILSSKN